MVLSAVRIPIQWCQPSFQHFHKNRKRASPSTRSSPHHPLSWKTLALLLFGLSFSPSLTAYALPGTNHAFLSGGGPSLDSHHQQSYLETALRNSMTTRLNTPYFADTANALPDPGLSAEPYCFVADTDSFPFIIDTGANRFIINDKSLFTTFIPRTGLVKGIGGSPVPLSGDGTIRLHLKSDQGLVDTITVRDAVYIPTSPFNLLPSSS
jgi:hypothetical protein